MNMDDFERQLQRQTIRDLPPEWREESLRAARVESRSSQRVLTEPDMSWWRAFFWPSQQAWAGVVTVWLVIAALQFSSAETAKLGSRKAAPTSQQVLELLQ